MDSTPTPIHVAANPASRRLRLGILAVLFVLLYLRQLSYLAGDVWQDPKYSHGFLVPLVCLWFLYVNRERLDAVERRPSGWALLIVVAGIFLWIHAQRYDFNAFAHLSMLVVLVGMIAFASGFRYLRAVAFPVLYLVFCFPIPKQLDKIYVILPLQGLASKVSAGALDLAGIPVFRQGNIIHIPGMELLVKEACSGIHSLYSLVALGTAFAFLTERRWWEKVLIVLATVPIAVLANVFRVTVTGLLAAFGSADLAKGFFHTFSGLLIFILGCGLVLLFSWFIRFMIPLAADGAGDEAGTETA